MIFQDGGIIPGISAAVSFLIRNIIYEDAFPRWGHFRHYCWIILISNIIYKDDFPRWRHSRHFICSTIPDEWDVADSQQADKHAAARDSRLPRIFPVHQGGCQVRAHPHPGNTDSSLDIEDKAMSAGSPSTPGRLPGQSSPTSWLFVNNLDIEWKTISAGRSPNKDSMQTIEKIPNFPLPAERYLCPSIFGCQ